MIPVLLQTSCLCVTPLLLIAVPAHLPLVSESPLLRPHRLLPLTDTLLTVDSRGTRDDVHEPECPVSLISLQFPLCRVRVSDDTHKWESTIGAPVNFRLIEIDEDLRMAEWSSPSITAHDTLLRPPYRLLVGQLDRCLWLWLTRY